jgi:hypothetical protein
MACSRLSFRYCQPGSFSFSDMNAILTDYGWVELVSTLDSDTVVADSTGRARLAVERVGSRTETER